MSSVVLDQSRASSLGHLGNARRFPLGTACLSALCGLLMSTLGYFAWYHVAHTTVWISDADEILYAEAASHAYFWHPLYLSDPTFVSGGQDIYSWLQIIPGELVCKLFRLSPIRFGLVLRIFGGLVVGFGWYAVLWQHTRRRWVALVAAVFLLTDSGWQITRPFLYQWTTLAHVVLLRSAEIFAHNPAIHREWRIISPVVVLPFLFLYIWCLRRSVDDFSRSRVILSGLAFGLLFFAYFFYWTAAGLALVLGIIVDRVHWRTYFHTGWIGALVGSPELARMLLTRHGQGSDWMHRFDELVPIPRLSEHGHFFLSAALVLLTFAIVWRYSKSLLYLWCLCASGFVMIHEQLFTGLQMQNYHWAYIFSPCMALLLILLVSNAVEAMGQRGRVVGRVLVAAVLLNAVAGLYLRGLETVRTNDSQRYSREFQAYEAQHGGSGNRELAAGVVTAGAEDFVQFAMIVDHVTPLAAAYPVVLSPGVSDLGLDRRVALNSYLSGFSQNQFEEAQRWELDHLQYGVERRDPARRAARFASRLACFDEIASNPAAAVERYKVRYVALPAGSARPAALGPEWVLLQSGPSWMVWERG